MYGYNYDELYSWATKLKEVLLSHRRIREVTVGSNFSWWKDDYQEFYFELDKQRMIGAGIGAGELFAAIRPYMGGIRKSVPLLPKMERKKSNSLPASRISGIYGPCSIILSV